MGPAESSATNDALAGSRNAPASLVAPGAEPPSPGTPRTGDDPRERAAPQTAPKAAAPRRSHTLVVEVIAQGQRAGNPLFGTLDVVSKHGVLGEQDLAESTVFRSDVPFSGVYEITCEARHFLPVTQRVTLTGEYREHRFEVRLSPSRDIAVRARTLNGQPLRLALTRTRWGDPEDLFARAGTAPPPGPSYPETSGSEEVPFTSDWVSARLHYRPAEVPEDVIGVVKAPPNRELWISLVYAGAVVEVQRLEDSATEVEFLLEASSIHPVLATVRARFVTTGDRRPAVGEASIETESGLVLRTALDASGSFVDEHVTPGDAVFTFAAEGMGVFSQQLRLDPGGVVDLGEIEVSPKSKILGKATRSDGRPFVGTLHCARIDPATGSASPGTERRARFQLDGSFEIDGVGRGRHVVWLATQPDRDSKDGFLGSAPQVVEVETAKTTIEVTAVPLTRVQFKRVSRDPLDRTAWSSEILGLGDVPVAAEDSWPAFHDRVVYLAPGTYDHIVSFDGDTTQRFPLAVATSPVEVQVGP